MYFINNTQGKLSATMSSETSVFSSEFLDALMIFLSECILLAAIFILIIFTGNSVIFFAIVPIAILTMLILTLLKKNKKLGCFKSWVSWENGNCKSENIYRSKGYLFFKKFGSTDK